MIEALGIAHLFQLTGREALAGFLTPLAVFAAFFVAQMVLPAIRVPGYVVNPETGKPRSYRLNGLLVYALAVIVWAFELTGMPRDWFYRASIYAVAGGTLLCLLFSLWAVFSRPRGAIANPLLALWEGRALEISFFNERFDVKMHLYVVGGAMITLNAMSGAAYHYGLFGADSNPGVFLYAAFLTYYVVDYLILERVQLYTYDVIHENVGFKLVWGGLMVYGWLYVLPLWGMAVHPHPGFSAPWTYVWLGAATALLMFGWAVARRAVLQKYVFKRGPDRKFIGLIQPRYIEAGERKILYSGFWGPARHFNYAGEAFLSFAMGLAFGHLNPWAWTYFVFNVSLFIWRQRVDESKCEEKYGAEKWAEYRARVRYRIFPGLY